MKELSNCSYLAPFSIIVNSDPGKNFSVDFNSNEEGSMSIVDLSRKAILLFDLHATVINMSLTLILSPHVYERDVGSFNCYSLHPLYFISCL